MGKRDRKAGQLGGKFLAHGMPGNAANEEEESRAEGSGGKRGASTSVTERSDGIPVDPIAGGHEFRDLSSDGRRKSGKSEPSDASRRCRPTIPRSSATYDVPHFHTAFPSGQLSMDRATVETARHAQALALEDPAEKFPTDFGSSNLIYRVSRMKSARRFSCITVHGLGEFLRLESLRVALCSMHRSRMPMITGRLRSPILIRTIGPDRKLVVQFDWY